MSYSCDGIHCTERHDALTTLLKENGCYSPLLHGDGQCDHLSPADKNYAGELLILQHDFTKDLEELADRVRTDLVIPFCDKHGLRFVASRGEYGFYTYDGYCCGILWERHPDIAPVGFDKIYEILNTDAIDTLSLYNFMEDYNGPYGGV